MELVVQPLDRILQVPPGANLLEILRANDVLSRTAVWLGVAARVAAK